MNTKLHSKLHHHTTRLLTEHRSLFYFLHPALLVLTGYCIVNCPLPVLLKSILFGATCLASGWLLYRLLMPASDETTPPFDGAIPFDTVRKQLLAGERKRG